MFRWIVTLTTLLILLFCQATGGGYVASAQRHEGAEGSAEKVSIRYFTWGAATEGFFKYAIAEFEKRHPNIAIRFELVSGDFRSKFMVQTTAGTAPDVVIVDSSLFPELVRAGCFLDITPMLEKDPDAQKSLEDFWPATYKVGEYNGRLYGWPFFWLQSQVLFYNPELFGKAGLNYPDETWKWKDMLDAAVRLTTKDTSGIAFGFGPFEFCTFPLLNGGGLVDNYLNPSKATLTDIRTLHAIEFFADLFFRYKVALLSQPWEVYPWSKGSVGMKPAWWGYAQSFTNAGFEDWDIAPMPTGPDALT